MAVLRALRCSLHALKLLFIRRFRAKHSSLWVNAVVEFFQQGSTISARMRRLAAASIPLTAKGRYRSGQTGQTVNLLALRLRWFESSPAQIFTRAPHWFPWSYRVLFREQRASC